MDILSVNSANVPLFKLMFKVLIPENTVGYPLFEGFWRDLRERKGGDDY
jgi:hypothetical protein